MRTGVKNESVLDDVVMLPPLELGYHNCHTLYNQWSHDTQRTLYIITWSVEHRSYPLRYNQKPIDTQNTKYKWKSKYKKQKYILVFRYIVMSFEIVHIFIFWPTVFMATDIYYSAKIFLFLSYMIKCFKTWHQ